MIPTWFGIMAIIQTQPSYKLQKVNQKKKKKAKKAVNSQTPMTTCFNSIQHSIGDRAEDLTLSNRAPLKPLRIRRAFSREGVSDNSWNAFWSHLEGRLQCAVLGGLPHCASGCHTKAAVLLLRLTFCSICWLKENQAKKPDGQVGILNIPKLPHSPFWRKSTKF